MCAMSSAIVQEKISKLFMLVNNLLRRYVIIASMISLQRPKFYLVEGFYIELGTGQEFRIRIALLIQGGSNSQCQKKLTLSIKILGSRAQLAA